MPRRVRLPGAAELFRPTRLDVEPPAPYTRQTEPPARQPDPESVASGTAGSSSEPRQVSRRVRHDEKITVYVSGDELISLEQARLTLRSEHGMAVDRGRIVREAIAAAVADLSDHGADSTLVQRLTSP